MRVNISPEDIQLEQLQDMFPYGKHLYVYPQSDYTPTYKILVHRSAQVCSSQRQGFLIRGSPSGFFFSL